MVEIVASGVFWGVDSEFDISLAIRITVVEIMTIWWSKQVILYQWL